MITRCAYPGCDAATKRSKEGGWTATDAGRDAVMACASDAVAV